MESSIKYRTSFVLFAANSLNFHMNRITVSVHFTNCLLRFIDFFDCISMLFPMVSQMVFVCFILSTIEHEVRRYRDEDLRLYWVFLYILINSNESLWCGAICVLSWACYYICANRNGELYFDSQLKHKTADVCCLCICPAYQYLKRKICLQSYTVLFSFRIFSSIDSFLIQNTYLFISCSIFFLVFYSFFMKFKLSSTAFSRSSI